MSGILDKFVESTGFHALFASPDWWKTLIMYAIVGVLVYLAVVKKFEPLLLLPIAFGMLLANLPSADLIHTEFFTHFRINMQICDSVFGEFDLTVYIAFEF